MGKKIKAQAQVKLEHIQQTKKVAEKDKNNSKSVKIQPSSLKQTGLPNARSTSNEKIKLQNKQQKQVKQTNKDGQKKEQNKKKKTKRARIIIRNLVFDINEKHIRKLMSPFGKIEQISIPKHPDRNCSRGFAFVEMSNKNQSLKAIKELNGTQYKGRPIVLDLAVSKDNFMTQKLNDKDVKEVKNQAKKEQMDEQKNSQDNNQVKDQQNQNDMKDQQDQQDQQVEQDQQEQQEQSQEENQEKAQKQRQDHLHQIFIRNLPISTTENDLYKHFSRHGKIHFAKICRNKQTNLSKGTAFIKFHDQEVPQKLIQYSRSYEMYLLKKLKNFTPDPTIKLQIDGFIMKIFPVQNREQITDKLKQREGQGSTNKKVKPMKRIKKLEDLVKTDLHDKRRLSLSLLGTWKADQSMNKYDYQFFKNHERQKIQKLKNPNALVSQTRIILKHLDKTVTEQDIKSICLKFLSDRNLRPNHLTYCKLMLEKDMKKSAGFAFIEFQKHQTAKQFIEKLTQNPNIIQNRLFIVQFAIQDSRKLQRLGNRNKNLQINNNKRVKQDKKGQKIKAKPKNNNKNQNKRKFIKKQK